MAENLNGQIEGQPENFSFSLARTGYYSTVTLFVLFYYDVIICYNHMNIMMSVIWLMNFLNVISQIENNTSQSMVVILILLI